MFKPKIIWLLIVLALGLAGAALLLLTRLPYAAAQPYLNLLAKDGTLESFTPELHAKITNWQWISWLLIFSAAGMIAARKWTQRIVADALSCARRVGRVYGADAKTLWQSCTRALRTDGVYWYPLGLVFAAALVNGAHYLSRPMLYDEAFTYNIFASRPMLRIISDYQLPNNHIFHSLLVHFTTGIFGSQPWAVRLPAFLAGVWLIPAGYLVARAFFDRDTALLSAALTGFMPILVDYATNARGYSLMALFSCCRFRWPRICLNIITAWPGH